MTLRNQAVNKITPEAKDTAGNGADNSHFHNQLPLQITIRIIHLPVPGILHHALHA
jgi:hypothetical protein